MSVDASLHSHPTGIPGMSISFHSIRSIIARRRLIRVVAGGCFAPLGLGGGTGEGGGGAAGDGGSRLKIE